MSLLIIYFDSHKKKKRKKETANIQHLNSGAILLHELSEE